MSRLRTSFHGLIFLGLWVAVGCRFCFGHICFLNFLELALNELLNAPKFWGLSGDLDQKGPPESMFKLVNYDLIGSQDRAAGSRMYLVAENRATLSSRNSWDHFRLMGHPPPAKLPIV